MNIKIENINNTNLVYIDDYGSFLNEYYQYIIRCFSKALSQLSNKGNLLIGNFNKSSINDFKIDTNTEHTLVKQGGRDSHGFPIGKIPYDDKFYLCRIQNLQYFETLDYIIDYSKPNIKNIETSGHFDYLIKRLIYISPIIFDINQFILKEKDITFISMFIDDTQTRRRVFLDKIKDKNINLSNIQSYRREDLKELYSKVKVLINIHQTDHHDTFEELRVLGALVNGVIVISEDVPLKEEIPYSDYIIWCNYDNIFDVMKDVEDNYQLYWNKIFGNDNLYRLLLKMEDDNINNIKNRLC